MRLSLLKFERFSLSADISAPPSATANATILQWLRCGPLRDVVWVHAP